MRSKAESLIKRTWNIRKSSPRLIRFRSVANKYGNEENILVGEARSTLVQAVFDFPRESKRGAVKHGERKREREGGEGEQRLAQRSQQPPRHLPVYLARDAARIKIANAIFLIRHPSLSRIPSPLGKHPVVGKVSQRIFQSRIFTGYFSRARVFSRRELFSPPRRVNCLVSREILVAQILRLPFAISDVSAFFVVHFLAADSPSSCIFPSYLSLDTFFPEHLFLFFIADFPSLHARLFSMFSHPLALLRAFFHHPLLHHGFSRRPFSSR